MTTIDATITSQAPPQQVLTPTSPLHRAGKLKTLRAARVLHQTPYSVFERARTIKTTQPSRPAAVDRLGAEDSDPILEHQFSGVDLQAGLMDLNTRQNASSSPSRRMRVETSFASDAHGSKLRRSAGQFNLGTATDDDADRGSLKRPHPFGAGAGQVVKPRRGSTLTTPVFASPVKGRGPAWPQGQSMIGTPTSFLSRSASSPTGPFTAPGAQSQNRRNRHDAAAHYISPEQSYSGVKPLQAAFLPPGLQSKQEAALKELPSNIPPETPCKKGPSLENLSVRSSRSLFDPHMSLFGQNSPSASHNLSSVLRGLDTPDNQADANNCAGLQDSIRRFSLGSENSPSTPTRMEPAFTSTPARAMRQISDASTITPGAFQRRPHVRTLQNILSAADHDSEDDLDLGTQVDNDEDDDVLMDCSLTSSELGSPRTPDVSSHDEHAHLVGSSSMDSTNSQDPRSQRHRHRVRIIANHEHFSRGSQTPSKEASFSVYAPTPANSVDESLLKRFSSVKMMGEGEFSAVFAVSRHREPSVRYAVKRTKRPLTGVRSRARRLEEVNILRKLTAGYISDEESDHVVHMHDWWEASGHLYIMTEFCENGNLDVFLSETGRTGRLDEWRVWKILAEVAHGLSYIHRHDVLHLDLKPANIFITFAGALKIGDFGMAAELPVAKSIEREGDREYIAPEILNSGAYSTAADVFSLGIMMIEIAANIVLPDNGEHWHKLRSGDLSDAGQLSSGDLSRAQEGQNCPPPWAPYFLVNKSAALDNLVSAMLNPEPRLRPTAGQLLVMPEVRFVDERRRAGAIVWEGDFGPEPVAESEASQLR